MNKLHKYMLSVQMINIMCVIFQHIAQVRYNKFMNVCCKKTTLAALQTVDERVIAPRYLV